MLSGASVFFSIGESVKHSFFALQLNVKRTTGIPGDELMETTADDPQAMMTSSGKYVIPIMHWKARNTKRQVRLGSRWKIRVGTPLRGSSLKG